MKRIKSENGAITLITLVTILFMISFLISAYVMVSNKVKTQKEMLAETRAIYEPKSTMEEIYNSYVNNENIIPIYTVEQLLAIGNGKKFNIDGKIHTFSNTNDIAYILKNDLEFNATELNLKNDWVPKYRDVNFLGNFDCNGHTLKLTTLNGDEIQYNGYLETINTTDSQTDLFNNESNSLVDYKIYGNSIQDGIPNSTKPVEIQSVGDLVTDETDVNYGKYKISITVKAVKNLTDTEPYEMQTYNIYLDEPLRKVGEHADYIDFENMEIVRKIEVKKINDLKWSQASNTGSFYRYEIYSVLTDKLFTNEYSTNLLCSHLQVVSYKISNVNYSIAERHNSNKLRILTSDLATIDEMLNKLGEASVYYVLATIPEPEPIELPDIQLYEGINTLTVDTKVDPSGIFVSHILETP